MTDEDVPAVRQPATPGPAREKGKDTPRSKNTDLYENTVWSNAPAKQTDNL